MTTRSQRGHRSTGSDQLAATGESVFFPGHPTLFRYHYFWFLISSFPTRLFHGFIGPRHALIAGVIWAGFTLMATIAIYFRLFDGEDSGRVRQRTFAAFGLLCISGLDIVPTLFANVCRICLHRNNNIHPSVDWWNRDQVTGWIDSVFWVPHHVAGMIACMTGFLILWVAWRKDEGRFRWLPVTGAALAIASGMGLSVYVGFVFSACLLAWAAVEFASKHFSRVLGLAASGLGAALLSAPYCLDLVRAGSGASFVRLGVRIFEPTHMILRALHLPGPAALQIGDLLSLPINFLFELGALFLIGIIQVRQWTQSDAPPSPAQRAGATLAAVSLVVCLFIRSNTIETNDLGMRGMLIVQFILVIWGADVILNWRAGRMISRDRVIRLASAALGTTLVIGAATNLYELFMLRGFAVLTDAGMNPGENLITPGEQFAAHAFATREMYDWLGSHSPASAVEQPNPFGSYDLLPGLYSNRQMSMTNAGMALAFGGDSQQVEMMTSRLHDIFETRLTPSRVDSLCQQSGIDILIATSADPVWNDAASWVWNREPVFSNSMARAVSCGFALPAHLIREQVGGDGGK